MSDTVYSVYSHRELPHQTIKPLPPFELTGKSVRRVNPTSPDTRGQWSNLIAKTGAFVPQVQRHEHSNKFNENSSIIRTIHPQFNFQKKEVPQVRLKREVSPENPGRLDHLYSKNEDPKHGEKKTSRKHYGEDEKTYMTTLRNSVSASNIILKKAHPLAKQHLGSQLKLLLHGEPEQDLTTPRNDRGSHRLTSGGQRTERVSSPSTQIRNYFLKSSIMTLPNTAETAKADVSFQPERVSSRTPTVRNTYTSFEYSGTEKPSVQKRDPNYSYSSFTDELGRGSRRSAGTNGAFSPRNQLNSVSDSVGEEWKLAQRKHVIPNKSSQRSTLQLI